MDYAKIWEAANAAGLKAMQDYTAQYPAAPQSGGIFDHGACGFAWVKIRPARGPFVAWCKKQNAALTEKKSREMGRPYPVKDFGDNSWNGGWEFWSAGSRGTYRGQSIDVKEVAARAFAKVLEENGIPATVGSRLD